jgi:hypothetical protein
MFAAQILHDPENAVAKTLEHAILKLNALMKQGNADGRWGRNLAHSTMHLEEKYHHDFIRYLANPAGYKAEGNIGQELEDIAAKTLPDEAKATIPSDLVQTYTLTRKGTDFDIVVENLKNTDLEDDEKNPV